MLRKMKKAELEKAFNVLIKNHSPLHTRFSIEVISH
ncbi:unnamed protein product [Brassica rapa subsp. trilocularis]